VALRDSEERRSASVCHRVASSFPAAVRAATSFRGNTGRPDGGQCCRPGHYLQGDDDVVLWHHTQYTGVLLFRLHYVVVFCTRSTVTSPSPFVASCAYNQETATLDFEMVPFASSRSIPIRMHPSLSGFASFPTWIRM